MRAQFDALTPAVTAPALLDLDVKHHPGLVNRFSHDIVLLRYTRVSSCFCTMREVECAGTLCFRYVYLLGAVTW